MLDVDYGSGFGSVVVLDSGSVVVFDSGSVVVFDSGSVVVLYSGSVVVFDSGSVVVLDFGSVAVFDSGSVVVDYHYPRLARDYIRLNIALHLHFQFLLCQECFFLLDAL